MLRLPLEVQSDRRVEDLVCAVSGTLCPLSSVVEPVVKGVSDEMITLQPVIATGDAYSC